MADQDEFLSEAEDSYREASQLISGLSSYLSDVKSRIAYGLIIEIQPMIDTYGKCIVNMQDGIDAQIKQLCECERSKISKIEDGIADNISAMGNVLGNCAAKIQDWQAEINRLERNREKSRARRERKSTCEATVSNTDVPILPDEPSPAQLQGWGIPAADGSCVLMLSDMPQGSFTPDSESRVWFSLTPTPLTVAQIAVVDTTQTEEKQPSVLWLNVGYDISPTDVSMMLNTLGCDDSNSVLMHREQVYVQADKTWGEIAVNCVLALYGLVRVNQTPTVGTPAGGDFQGVSGSVRTAEETDDTRDSKRPAETVETENTQFTGIRIVPREAEGTQQTQPVQQASGIAGIARPAIGVSPQAIGQAAVNAQANGLVDQAILAAIEQLRRMLPGCPDLERVLAMLTGWTGVDSAKIPLCRSITEVIATGLPNTK